MEPNFPKCFKRETKPHKFCPGCGYGVVLKNLGKVIDELNLQKITVMLTDIGCNLLAWDFFDIPTSQTHHGRTIATAVGFKMADSKKQVVCLIGDGGGYAIGLQNLIYACLRNEPLTVVLVNNTNYGMTGGQLAPTTIEGQITDSTPSGKTMQLQGKTFFGPELLRTIAWKNSYIARTSVGYPQMIKNYLKKALDAQKNGNFSFLEIVSGCPLNWKTNARQTLERVKELEKTFHLGEFA